MQPTLPGSILSPRLDTASSFHDSPRQIDSPLTLVDKYIEDGGQNPLDLEEMAKSLTECHDPIQAERDSIRIGCSGKC